MKNISKKNIFFVFVMILATAMYSAAIAEEDIIESFASEAVEIEVVAEVSTIEEVAEIAVTEEFVEEDIEEEATAETISVEESATGDQEAEVVIIEDEPIPFAGSVLVVLKNEGEIYYGDTVVLKAIVLDANTEYKIRWECSDGSEWEEISGENEQEYSFELTEENAKLMYRVVLVTEA